MNPSFFLFRDNHWSSTRINPGCGFKRFITEYLSLPAPGCGRVPPPFLGRSGTTGKLLLDIGFSGGQKFPPGPCPSGSLFSDRFYDLKWRNDRKDFRQFKKNRLCRLFFPGYFKNNNFLCAGFFSKSFFTKNFLSILKKNPSHVSRRNPLPAPLFFAVQSDPNPNHVRAPIYHFSGTGPYPAPD